MVAATPDILFARGCGEPDERFTDVADLACVLHARAVRHGGPLRVRYATVARGRRPSGPCVCVHLGEDDTIIGYAFAGDALLLLDRLSAALRALAGAEVGEKAA